MFIHVDADGAIAAAEAMDRLRKVNAEPSPFAGIPISIKDLFDIRGQVSRAASRARDDAPVVARLRCAGFVVIGRASMTEFAYSSLGINPHYGASKNCWRRNLGYVPGASSSSAAVSSTVAWRMARSAPTPAALVGSPQFIAAVGYKRCAPCPA